MCSSILPFLYSIPSLCPPPHLCPPTLPHFLQQFLSSCPLHVLLCPSFVSSFHLVSFCPPVLLPPSCIFLALPSCPPAFHRVVLPSIIPPYSCSGPALLVSSSPPPLSSSPPLASYPSYTANPLPCVFLPPSSRVLLPHTPRILLTPYPRVLLPSCPATPLPSIVSSSCHLLPPSTFYPQFSAY